MFHFDTPSDALLKEVRAVLVMRGTSLNAFCQANGFVRQAVTFALSGARSGPRAQKLKDDFLASERAAK